MARPFMKWAGGKHRLVDRIRRKLPKGRRLIEPFAGSCVVSLNIDYERYLLNDINSDVIDLYKALQRDGEEFIERCRSLFTEKSNTPERFYALRERFNKSRDALEKSAILVYLNRHGYNGLCRYNSSGQFNVPFGRYDKPYFPESEMLYFHEKLKKAEFRCEDFEVLMGRAKEGDVVYCDPPYVPLNDTAKFTQYSAGGFSQADQERLADAARRLARKGIVTVISNHGVGRATGIYEGARIERFSVRRNISCKGLKRDMVDEVLAVFK